MRFETKLQVTADDANRLGAHAFYLEHNPVQAKLLEDRYPMINVLLQRFDVSITEDFFCTIKEKPLKEREQHDGEVLELESDELDEVVESNEAYLNRKLVDLKKVIDAKMP